MQKYAGSLILLAFVICLYIFFILCARREAKKFYEAKRKLHERRERKQA